MNLRMNLRPTVLVALAFVALALHTISCMAAETITLSPTDEDMTPAVRKAIESAQGGDLKLVFEKGTYRFLPDFAFENYCTITNHGNGLKRIIFPFMDFDSVEIEGNGAEFIFHGQAIPFQFDNCSRVTVKDITVDWDIPFTFLAEVVAVNAAEQWRDVKPMTDGFSWKIAKGKLLFPNIDGFSYAELGSTLAFDAEEKRVAHGALDLHSNPHRVEKRPGGILRMHEKLRQFPPVGTLLSSKGDRAQDRYGPAFHLKSSSNIRFENATVHHALGMGFLMERCDTATLSGCGVHLREGSNRVISSTADATHFCNCRGKILVENCRIENMLDDGTNVHGTYVEVQKILNEKTVRVEFQHFEQSGFFFADFDDEIWFIHQPDPSRASVGKVESTNVVNGRFIEITFKEPVPKKLVKGDVLENKTWNPEFTMRGCSIRNHRARNVVLKSPLKTVIEDNDFSSMMSSIFFRGETFFWFESGAVEDVTIRNNRFEYCAYSGMEHAVLNITPRLGKSFDQSVGYDRNIRFENNSIKTFDSRIVWADRVTGLVVSGNTIEKSGGQTPLYPDAPTFELTNCTDAKITGNVITGFDHPVSKIDDASAASLTFENNEGITEAAELQKN